MLSTSNLALNYSIKGGLNACYPRGQVVLDKVLKPSPLLEDSITTTVDCCVDLRQHLLQLHTTLLRQVNAVLRSLDRGHKWQPVFVLEDWLTKER